MFLIGLCHGGRQRRAPSVLPQELRGRWQLQGRDGGAYVHTRSSRRNCMRFARRCALWLPTVDGNATSFALAFEAREEGAI